jgi:hypothetical protein
MHKFRTWQSDAYVVALEVRVIRNLTTFLDHLTGWRCNILIQLVT